MSKYSLVIDSSNTDEIIRVEEEINKMRLNLIQGKPKEYNEKYNILMLYLENIHPESLLLQTRGFELKTVQKLDFETEELIEEHAYLEENKLRLFINPEGVNVDLTYKEGELVEAVGFGRTLNGKNLLKEVQQIIGERNDIISEFDEVKVKGTIVLPYEALDLLTEEDKDSFSLTYDVVFNQKEYIFDYLEFIVLDIEVSGFEMKYEEKLKFAKEHYFEVPHIVEKEINLEEESILEVIDSALYSLEVSSENLYKTDSIQVITKDHTVILIKMGKWDLPIERDRIVGITYELEDDELYFSCELERAKSNLKLSIGDMVMNNLGLNEPIEYYKINHETYLKNKFKAL